MAIPTWTWAGRSDRSDGSPSSEPTSTPASASRAAALEDEVGDGDGNGDGDGSEPESRRTPAAGPEASAAQLSRLSSEFDLLSSPVRLEILLSLADRDRPLRYTDLRAATSIEDNGKLNYHLRRLEGLVAGRDGGDERGYVLTARGRRLLERIPRAGSRSSES